jgi:hypothetical protein
MPITRRVLWVFSVCVVAVLVIVAGYQMSLQFQEEVNVESIIQRTEVEDSLIVKFTVTNNKGRDGNFTFNFYINDVLRREKTFLLPPQEKVIFTANINTIRTVVNKLSFLVYEMGSPEPVSSIVHYVD